METLIQSKPLARFNPQIQPSFLKVLHQHENPALLLNDPVYLNAMATLKEALSFEAPNESIHVRFYVSFVDDFDAENKSCSDMASRINHAKTVLTFPEADLEIRDPYRPIRIKGR